MTVRETGEVAGGFSAEVFSGGFKLFMRQGGGQVVVSALKRKGCSAALDLLQLATQMDWRDNPGAVGIKKPLFIYSQTS